MEVPLQELRALTRAKHSRKVCVGLAELGIPYKLLRGAPVVLRQDLLAAFNAKGAAAEIDINARLARRRKGIGKEKTQRRRPA
jgi:hypothetical protein